jgi:hypothetical protein
LAHQSDNCGNVGTAPVKKLLYSKLKKDIFETTISTKQKKEKQLSYRRSIPLGIDGNVPLNRLLCNDLRVDDDEMSTSFKSCLMEPPHTRMSNWRETMAIDLPIDS